MMNKIFCFLFCFLCFEFNVVPARAQHFESSSYIIDWGNFNITSGRKNSANYSLTDTVGQNAPGAYSKNGYTIKSGFQYIYNTFNEFSFSIDNLNITLGDLVPGIGSTDTNIITVTTPSGHGYQVMSRYNHPLVNEYGTTIPDISPGNWTSNTIYGFGFNVIGINNTAPLNYFANSDYYRPFSLIPETIMSEDNPIINSTFKYHSAQVSYKANISAIQPPGNYENSIIFIAVPKY
jgi:hypothetical protein